MALEETRERLVVGQVKVSKIWFGLFLHADFISVCRHKTTLFQSVVAILT